MIKKLLKRIASRTPFAKKTQIPQIPRKTNQFLDNSGFTVEQLF